MTDGFNFSKRSMVAIMHARKEAIRFKSPELTVEHLFLGVVKTDDPTREVLFNLRIDVEQLISILSHQNFENRNKAKDPNLSKAAEKIIKIALLESKLLRGKFIEPYHLIMAMMRDSSNLISRELDKIGAREKIKQEIKKRVESGKLRSSWFFPKWF